MSVCQLESVQGSGGVNVIPKLPDRDKCPGAFGRTALKYPAMDLLLHASSFHCLDFFFFHILLFYIYLLGNLIMDLLIIYEILISNCTMFRNNCNNCNNGVKT